MAHNTYNSGFYSENQENSYRSAKRVVPLVCDLISPASVVDVGCGSGAWLKAFSESGVAQIRGVDGPWVKPDSLLIKPEVFQCQNLEDGFALGERFDLAVSLEVAEHLDNSFADEFVKQLTSLSDVVLFSAAIPHQGGTRHVNEQWQSWWASKFKDHDYLPLDYLRPKIWELEDVAFWFKQNLFLYVKSERLQKEDLRQLAALQDDLIVMDIVHPRLYLPKARNVEKMNRLIPGFLKKLFS
jgi:SAM-dependent methyltransferase